MKLLDALETLNKPVIQPVSNRQVSLLCGFTPLHLQTFLAAHLRISFPKSLVEIRTGLYGDLAGNLERLQLQGASAACIVIEWSDLDPRLGIRSLGSWRASDIADIVKSARQRGERLAQLIKQASEMMPVYASMPTLPLPPIFITGANQAQLDEWKLLEVAAVLAVSLSAAKQIKLINPQRIDEISPLSDRFNPKTGITSDFPYSLEHASKLAELFVALIKNEQPRKGLITDLDDTLWSGVLGEAGVDGICWEMGSSAHIHGLYQRFLGSLASAGVLLAVASKNDLTLVEKALLRSDLLFSKESLFPVEAHWNIKSKSVRSILKAWNILPEDVVYIDDSPIEVAEVQSSFPTMECIVFPRNDYVAMWELLKRLRERFGKSTVSEEDQIRLSSIRRSVAHENDEKSFDHGVDNFLRDAEATITFTLKPDFQDNRAFELINKTNQFNLNGKRLDQSEWLKKLQEPGAFLLTASYQDKYGPLGKIASVMGKCDGPKLLVGFWVMSCRAFSRRIEHQCLKYLFTKMGAHEIVFDFLATPRNGPIQDFLGQLLGCVPSPNSSLRSDSFYAKMPPLHQRVVEGAGD